MRDPDEIRGDIAGVARGGREMSQPTLQLPVKPDKANGLCGYCRRGLTAALLSDGRTRYCCPVNCKPWMTGAARGGAE